MLPTSPAHIKLSEDSARKLDRYYQRYCTGKNASTYGLSHIVFACQASFPLLLSPELLNLTWLNFKTYSSGAGSSNTIEREVVSDFLLSPLVRQVAAKQYEVIPDIRNYLLYLLKDANWFSLYGIGPFGDPRLRELAEFLHGYLNQKKIKQANDDMMFRQVNRWTALSYLEPDKLTSLIAAAFSQTLNASQSHNNETEQFRINMLVNRFGNQLESGILDTEAEGKQAFINLKLYSNATNAQLFGRADLADKLLLQLDNDFIDTGNTDNGSLIQLPIRRKIGERLKRKKNNTQKVHSVLINAGNDSHPVQEDRLKEMLRGIHGSRFDTKHVQRYPGDAALNKNGILESIESTIRAMDPEDSCFIYFNGQSGFSEFGECSISIPSGRGNELLTKSDLTEIIRASKKSISQQVLMILDVNSMANEDWMTDELIILSAIRDPDEFPSNSYGNQPSAFFDAFVELVMQSEGRITYSELQRLMNFRMRVQNHLQGSQAKLQCKTELSNHYFLTYEFADAARNDFLVTYNPEKSEWRVLEEDFILPTLNSTTHIFNYNDTTNPFLGRGELFARDGNIKFGGSVESLSRNKNYKAVPQRKALSFVVLQAEATASVSPNPLEFRLFSIKFGKLSHWDTLEGYTKPYSSKTNFISDLESKDFFEILLVEELPGHAVSYRLSFYKKNAGSELTEPGLFCGPVSDKGLEEAILKLARYQWFLSLQTPAGAPIQYEEFNVEIYCKWKDEPELDIQQKPAGSSLRIIDEAILLRETGEIAFSSITMVLANQETVPLYFDVYLVAGDLSIHRVDRGNQNIIQPGQSVSIETDQPVLFLKVIEEQLDLKFKILLSLEPIQTDFSQPGVNS